MNTTPVSLLERVQAPGATEAWDHLVDLYDPLIRQWLGRWGLQASDADDLTQDVLTVLVRKLPDFHHDQRAGSFRSWLRAITANRVRDFWRARAHRPLATGDQHLADTLDRLEDPHSDLARRWDQEHDRHVLRRLTELIRDEFKTTTWQAFRRHVVEGRAADVVARELGLTANAVLIAKSRVLRRLREEARGLLDESEPPT